MTMNKTSIILGNANINSALSAFSASRREINAQANIILCSAINHVHLHGDTTGLLNFINVFKDGSTDYRAIMNFVKAFSPCRAVRKDGKLTGFKVDKEKVVADFLDSALGAEMLAVPFYEYKKEDAEEKEKPAYVPAVAFSKFYDGMKKRLEKENVTLSPAMREALEALMAVAKDEAMEAEKAKAIAAIEKKFDNK